MSELTILNLEENQLSGQIPSWLVNRTQLTALEGSLFELVNLQYLFLNSNNLTGTVELHMLSKLKNLTDFLGLASSNLTRFPDLQNQNELEILILTENKIHGPIPKWVWNISKETLRALDLSGNFLTDYNLIVTCCKGHFQFHHHQPLNIQSLEMNWQEKFRHLYVTWFV